MPIDWEQLKPQMADLALEHICRRCKSIIPGAHYRIAGEDGNYHTFCYEEDKHGKRKER
jgi:hypothetical protein